MRQLCLVTCLCGIMLGIFWKAPQSFAAYPVKFIDDAGNSIVISQKPTRVVSLVPGITEILFRIGAGDAVEAVTYHDTYPAGVADKKKVGGFFAPSVEAVQAIRPDVIFLADIHRDIRNRCKSDTCSMIVLENSSVRDLYRNVELVGQIFDRPRAAAELIDAIQGQIEIIAAKVAKIPKAGRKRVIRLMGRDTIMTPGDDSFQNELIRLAGGIPPRLCKQGHIVPVTKEEWINFNPEVIYGCGGDRLTARRFFAEDGWKDVDAVRHDRIFFFPCDLTCRVSTRVGSFVSCLAAKLYRAEFSVPGAAVMPNKIIGNRTLEINLDCVKKSGILYSHINDWDNKTLFVELNKPTTIVSTLEGIRQGITAVGNHYAPGSCWDTLPAASLPKLKRMVCDTLGVPDGQTGLLFTAADVDKCAIVYREFGKNKMYTLVTAGVRSNAMRMSADEGSDREPGTINIVILSDANLTPRAMTRALITATEAKTAALMDLDIRSSYTPMNHQATGTGTDNIMIVSGGGTRVDCTGGHSKMGELIAKAVYEGVRKAVYAQNGMSADRHVFHRLEERNIDVYGIISASPCGCRGCENNLMKNFEALLLNKRYAAFMTAMCALSDNYERNLTGNLDVVEKWCDVIADEIAGKQIETRLIFTEDRHMPPVLRMALNAILNGLYYRQH